MASHFLTTISTLSCPHGGSVTLSTSNTRVRADDHPIVRSTDASTIDGCSFTIGTVPHPCVRVQWDTHAEHHTSQSDPSLTLDSLGWCVAGDGAIQGTVSVSSTQRRAAGE